MRLCSMHAAAVALFWSVSAVQAQVSRTCPTADSKICYSLNLPNVTSQSGNGDIYFQIQAPSSSYSWIALGQGSRMAGSHIFVLYLSASGNNVTISPRLGTGHVQPRNADSTTQSSQLALLEGSGISNGIMTANVRCGGCTSWSGGSMDFTASSARWIFAYKAGSPIRSDNLNQAINEHDDYGAFDWDFSAARGGSPLVNPFLTTSDVTEVAVSTSSGGSTPDGILIAHAVFACLSIALVLPAGGILIRLANFQGLLMVHSAIQVIGAMMFTVAFALGAYYATQNGYWTEAHPTIGTVIFALVLLQPALGILHHRSYKKVQQRGVFSWAHLTLGRVVILLGIINGGLGLALTNQSQAILIGYSIAAGLVGLVYISAIIFGEARRRKNMSRTPSSEALAASDKVRHRNQQMY